MKAHHYTPRIDILHKSWLSSILKVRSPTSEDRTFIDLVDDTIGIEIKSRLKKYSPRFSCVEHQIHNFPEQNPQKELYWAFMLYELDRTVKEVSISPLEQQVTNREVWIQPWSWIDQYQVSHGKQESYRYAVLSDLKVPEYETIAAEKGIVHIPKQSPLLERIYCSEKFSTKLTNTEIDDELPF